MNLEREVERRTDLRMIDHLLREIDGLSGEITALQRKIMDRREQIVDLQDKVDIREGLKMPTIPRAICVPCGLAYRIQKNGVRAVNRAVNRFANGEPYFTVQSDRYACEGCGHEVLVGFGLDSEWEQFEGEDARNKADNDVDFYTTAEDKVLAQAAERQAS